MLDKRRTKLMPLFDFFTENCDLKLDKYLK